MKKVQDAPVITDGMKLDWQYKTCTRCGIKARILGEGEKSVKVACCVDEDFIPYEESLCHPMIVSKHWKVTTFFGGVGRYVTGKWSDVDKKDNKVCVVCTQMPGTRGCRKINSKYNDSMPV